VRELFIAGRTLARSRAFAAAAILTLAAGIAVSTAVFSLVDGVLLEPLPFPNPDRLVTVFEASPSRDQRTSLIAPARLADWVRLNQGFAAISGSYAENVTDTSVAEPERLAGRRVMPRYCDVFAMAPAAGRTFTAEEEQFGGPAAVVVSSGFAQRRFGDARRAVGARLVLGCTAWTIVGVMPATFTTAAIDAWLPAQASPQMLRVREARFLSGVARMKAGVTTAQAEADLARVQRALAAEYPRSDSGWSVTVGDLKDSRVGAYRRPLWLVFAAVSLLLLVAVTNIAGLMLVQLRRRGRELAVRAALGASRRRLVGTIAREAALVAAAGAMLGTLLSTWLVRLLASAFASLPRAGEITLNVRALAFVLAVSAVTTLVFGVWPALHATDDRLAPAAADGGRTGSPGRHPLHEMLAVAQVALSLLLASAAALLLRSYGNLAQADVGFKPEGTVTFHVGAAWDEDRARVGRMQEELVATLARLPGVSAAGITNFLPATGATLRYQVLVDGAARSKDAAALTVGERTVSAGYLQALRVPLVAGEWCGDLRFDFSAPRKMLVNHRFADEYGGAARVLGRHVRFDQDPRQPLEIVGVVGNVAEDGVGASAAPYVYACESAGAWPDPDYVVRTAGNPAALEASVRKIVHRIAPGRAVFGVKPVDEVLHAALDEPRLNARLVSVFAGAAVLLAALGLYGVLTLLVVDRTRELGVRLALGAPPASLVCLVLARAGRLVVGGLAAGLALVVAVQPLLRALLFGVTPVDPVSLALSIAVLGAVGFAAAVVPALRAGAIDPIGAIRAD